MVNLIKNRSEILFIYDIENANPNGDPLNENRPRFDNESSTILVSDVRLKRTIRDYWYESCGFNGSNGRDIYVRETKYKLEGKEYVSDGKRRAKEFREDKETVLDSCIDIRVFGGVLPLKNDSITLTGPVQFQMGRSLNRTEIITEQGTGAFASGEKKGQATFRVEHKVPYAVIGFNGIINEKVAGYSKMTEDDKELLIKGIWEGTKDLISRSKFGQAPRLLMMIDYKEPFYIGGLRQLLKLVSEKDEIQIRSLKDYKLDLTDVINELKKHAEKIEKIYLRVSDVFDILYNGNNITVKNNELKINEI